MATQSRVRLYTGIVEAQAEQRFSADAALAAQQGWFPIERRWDGSRLRVVYIHPETTRRRTSGHASASIAHPVSWIRRRHVQGSERPPSR